MSNSYNVTQPDVSLSEDGATFDVQNGASLTLTGSSDYVILEGGSGGATVTGNSNTVSGSAAGARVSVSGIGNTVTLGAGSTASDSGQGNTITIGENGSYRGRGTNSIVYATQGNDWLDLDGSGETAYANDDYIGVGCDTVTVHGNGNTISADASGDSSRTSLVNLAGSNNTIALGGGLKVLTSTGSATQGEDGTVVLTGSADAGGATLTGGMLSVQMGDGNVATLSGVKSGTQIEYVDASGNATWTTLLDTGAAPANQLVSAMASYLVDGGVAATSLLTMQPAVNTAIFASSLHA